MEREISNLHQRNQERVSDFASCDVWVDRQLSPNRDVDGRHEIHDARSDTTDFDSVMADVAIPNWVRQIELKFLTEPRISQRGWAGVQLETEFGHQTLLRLASLRVGRVVERRRIWRGYLDTVCSQPFVTESRTPNLYFFLISTPGYGQLMRENHNFGYHYHYSDNGIRRADILLTFSRKPIDPSKPITWEPHAITKADFKARVPKWGQKKRQSVHVALMSDLRKRCIADYLRPGKHYQFLMP